MKPVGNPCRKQVAPPARLSVICRVLLVAGLGGRRAYGKRREHFRFVRSKEFDDGLGTFGAADEELVAYGFDAKSHFLGAAQERYSVHSPSSSAMVRSDAIPPASSSVRSVPLPSPVASLLGQPTTVPRSEVSRSCRTLAASRARSSSVLGRRAFFIRLWPPICWG